MERLLTFERLCVTLLEGLTEDCCVIDIHMGSGGDEKDESIPEEVRLAKNLHIKRSIGDISHH